jgi:choline-sulfatase
MVRSQDWKLIYYPMIRKTQLFNLANDPEELNDLAADPAQAERIAAMMQELEGLKAMVGDPLTNEEPERSYGDFLNMTWD